MRDRDSKLTAQFDDVMKGEGIDVVKVGLWAPNMNAHMERFMLTLQDECLNHIIVFGEAHLRFLANEFLRFYHEQRPHQSLDNLPLSGKCATPPENWKPNDIACEEKLGGVLRTYGWRVAA